ncbi:MAG: hypothetical protein WC119_00270 [Synergistaceae bacterium]
MIIESDEVIYSLQDPPDKDEQITVRAIRSAYSDEWIIFTENDYGELDISLISEAELVEQNGEIPKD